MCSNDDIRGRAGTGSVLSLSAIGKQDTFLTSDDPKDSFFNYENIQHSNFAMFERVTTIDTTNSPNWPFGHELVFKFKPTEMSDLLSNMYLRCNMPRLKDIEGKDGSYCDQIGRAIIKKIKFRVDEFDIETIENDWPIIKDELFMTQEEKNASKYLVNAGQDVNGLPTSGLDKRGGPFTLYIPLNLFFCRKHSTSDTDNTLMLDKYYKPYFPLCAITKQEIQVTIEFNPVTFFALTDKECTLPFVDIITQEITISDQERNFLQQQQFETAFEVVKRNPVIDVSGSERDFKSFLVPQIPVKSVFWFVRKAEYENTGNYENYLNRYNYGTSADSNVYLQQFSPIISDARLFLNGDQVTGFAEDAQNRTKHDAPNFHKFVQSQKSYLSSPVRNIYTHSFALKPKEPAPTGALDFSTMESSRSFIQCSFMDNVSVDDNFKFHIYFVGYQVLKFGNGFLGIKYSTS